MATGQGRKVDSLGVSAGIPDKATQKQIERMAKGREEKERIKMFTERGALQPPKEVGNAMNESTMTAATISKRPGTVGASAS